MELGELQRCKTGKLKIKRKETNNEKLLVLASAGTRKSFLKKSKLKPNE